MLALAAGFGVSPISATAGGFTDSLHYRFSSDTAIWNEELAAYTFEIDFEMKWDVPDQPIAFMSVGMDFDPTAISFLSVRVDSGNWQQEFVHFFPQDPSKVEWEVALEWGTVGPESTFSRTTGSFVTYGSFSLIALDNSNPFNEDITFIRSTGNHTEVGPVWFLLDSNYTDGSLTFLGVTKTPCCNSPADANNNGQFNIADVTFVISRIFAGGAPAPCLAEADADANASLNIADVTFMIARIFAGGPAPSCVSTII